MNGHIVGIFSVIVILLSIVIEPDALPYRYTLPAREKLQYDSDTCIYEIRALSKVRVKEKLAHVSEKELRVIQDALCMVTG